jgi:15-cis-phytoene synthase
MTAVATSSAYETCRRVARASGSSFYTGMRLLPAERRAGIFAIYALARRIDDLADGDLPPEQKLERLEAVRESLARIDDSVDPVLVAVRDVAARFPVPLDAFVDIVEGAEMDVRGERYATFADLEIYCRHVAGAIGRLCLGLFETTDRASAEPLADDLGVALQLGNIVRDVTEDLARGRVYFPLEDLDRFGCVVRGSTIEGPAELVVAFEAERGLGWLARGLELVPLLDRRSASAVLAMANSYQRLLVRMASRPADVLEARPSLAAWEKSWVLVRSLAGGVR